MMFIVSAMEKVPVDDNDQPLEEIKIISHNLCDSTHGTRGRGRGREGKRIRLGLDIAIQVLEQYNLKPWVGLLSI